MLGWNARDEHQTSIPRTARRSRQKKSPRQSLRRSPAGRPCYSSSLSPSSPPLSALATIDRIDGSESNSALPRRQELPHRHALSLNPASPTATSTTFATSATSTTSATAASALAIAATTPTTPAILTIYVPGRRRRASTLRHCPSPGA
jgi:hypothetical protein